MPLTSTGQESRASGPAPSPRSEQSNPDQGITREQAAKIIQELQMIRMDLEREINFRTNGSEDSKASQRVHGDTSSLRTITSLGDHILGDDKAPVTLVEFLDLECSFCMQFHKNVLPQLQRKYIQTGKVRLAIVDFPLDSHPYAVQAAKLANCAGRQGKYWQVHDSFLSNPQIATDDVVRKIADENNLDQGLLKECFADPRTIKQIALGSDAARKIGVFGTPTFLLGKSQENGAIGSIIQGVPSVNEFETRIEQLLN